jgi:hypothetical protein
MTRSSQVARGAPSNPRRSDMSTWQKGLFWRLFGAPIVVGILIFAGLASGVLGDGIWDVLSWIALAIPLSIIAVYVLRPSGS